MRHPVYNTRIVNFVFPRTSQILYKVQTYITWVILGSLEECIYNLKCTARYMTMGPNRYILYNIPFNFLFIPIYIWVISLIFKDYFCANYLKAFQSLTIDQLTTCLHEFFFYESTISFHQISFYFMRKKF